MRGRPERDDAGFTLIEILIAMFIVVLVLSAVAAAFIAASDVVGVSSIRLSEANDRLLVEVWLPQDVQSAQSALVKQPATCAQAILHATTAPTAVVVLKGSGEQVITHTGSPNSVHSTVYEADYVLTQKVSTQGNGWILQRYFCSTTSITTMATFKCANTGAVCTHQAVSFNLAESAATAVVATVTKTTVSLTMTDTKGNTFAVSGRMQSGGTG